MSGKNPKMPKGGYCLRITRNKLLSLWLAMLFLFFGAALGIYSWMELQADKSAWDYMEYIKMIIGWAGSLFFLAIGLGTAYTSLRDAFFPQKSTLANSIRSQLPYPDAAPGVQELFAMVDRDIETNGQWFDKVAVGKEWVLGDEASYIPRIRVFFGRDEIKSHRSGERVNTTRILELHILDDRRQHQITTLHNPKELQALLDCISLRAPDALRRPYSEYNIWVQKSDMEWENMLREYRVRQGERDLAAFQAGNADAVINQNMILTYPDGRVTSRVTKDLIREAMEECLSQGEGTFSLSAGCPVEREGIRYVEMECSAGYYEEDWEDLSFQEMEKLGEAELFLKMTATGEAGKAVQSGRICQMDIPSAERILEAWLRGEIPKMKDWEATPLFMEQEQPKKRVVLPPHLGLMTPAGVFQSHDRFTLEDVEVAAEGLVDGTYRMVDLTLQGGYLWMRIQGGDASDGRCKVSVTRADSDKLRYFRNQCTHRQAAAWLTAFAKGTFQPDWKEWKDYTRQAEKEYKRKQGEK
ncbi:MAG: hypothetical protein K2O16_04195 [Lachnospiraceae bacterium]|nr:hypothetical protein [Lachnospiraceae bacterium]